MDKTIDMARETGFAIDVSTDPNSPPSWWGAGHDDRFKAFEALVRADERGIQREKTLAALMSIERKGDWITKQEAFEAIQRVEN
jgi:hypothetical protein